MNIDEFLKDLKHFCKIGVRNPYYIMNCNAVVVNEKPPLFTYQTYYQQYNIVTIDYAAQDAQAKIKN